MSEEEYKEFKLPVEIKSLEEYKQCVDKIYNWFCKNQCRILDLSVDLTKQLEFIDAQTYFFITAIDLVRSTMFPEDKALYPMAKMLFDRIINSLQFRLFALDNRLKIQDNSCDKK